MHTTGTIILLLLIIIIIYYYELVEYIYTISYPVIRYELVFRIQRGIPQVYQVRARIQEHIFSPQRARQIARRQDKGTRDKRQ